MFILFDFVVHNPRHVETRDNLSLLEVAAGHFSLQEYKSKGTIPYSLVGEFSHIARQHVRNVEAQDETQSTTAPRQGDDYNLQESVGAVERQAYNGLVCKFELTHKRRLRMF